MHPAERAFQWTAGAVFVGALAFCAYTFAAVWSASRAAQAGLSGFNPAALAVDALLFTVFATHHSVFAREPIKTWLAQIVPQRLLRSVYVWIASLLLIAVCTLWRPIGGVLYEVTGWQAALHAAVQLGGLAIIADAVRKIDALELAGIREHAEAQPLQIGGPYRLVRHPIYLGWLLATFGAAAMTADRLAFASISALYLIIAMPIEEQALRREFGESYARYMGRVRWRVLPYIY